MLTTRLLRMLPIVAFAAASLGASCGQRAVTLLPGVLNNSGNRSLRRAILSFATSRICETTKGMSIPLRMGDADPSIGRFFPTGCAVTELGNQNLFVQFIGHGYGWTNVTRRVGFEAAASVEYDQDFLVDGSSMYVYFRQVRTPSTTWKPLLCETRDGGVAGAALSFLGQDVTTMLEPVARRVMEGQLARGFTVVRDADGAVTFALGVLEKGARPAAPFEASKSSTLVLANDRTELHVGQRDYVGPFVVPEGSGSLIVTAVVEGAPGVDVFVVPRAAGDIWEAQYERYAQTGPAPFPAVGEDAIAAPGTPGTPVNWRREFRVMPGSYYVVFDHTATAGRTNPVSVNGDDRAALVSYGIEVIP